MVAIFDGCQLAQDKTEGLTTCLEYLGIKIDTVALEMRLPPHKLERLCVDDPIAETPSYLEISVFFTEIQR